MAPGAKGLRAVEIPAPAPLTTVDGEVIVPGSGEMFDPKKVDHVTLGEYLRRARDLEDQLKAAKQLVGAEVLARMDHAASWTLPFGPGKMTSQSPRTEPKYKGENLRANLLPLVEEGKIGEEALAAAVKEVTDYKAMKGGIKKLRALGDPDIDRAIELSEEPDDSPRRISLKIEEQ